MALSGSRVSFAPCAFGIGARSALVPDLAGSQIDYFAMADYASLIAYEILCKGLTQPVLSGRKIRPERFQLVGNADNIHNGPPS